MLWQAHSVQEESQRMIVVRKVYNNLCKSSARAFDREDDNDHEDNESDD